jgi:hypothetical protein
LVAEAEWEADRDAKKRVKEFVGVLEAHAESERVSQGVALLEREPEAQPETVPEAEAEPEKEPEGDTLGELDGDTVAQCVGEAVRVPVGVPERHCVTEPVRVAAPVADRDTEPVSHTLTEVVAVKEVLPEADGVKVTLVVPEAQYVAEDDVDPLRDGVRQPEGQLLALRDCEALLVKLPVPLCVIDCDWEHVKLPEKEAEPVREGVGLPVGHTDALGLPVWQPDTVPDALALRLLRLRLAEEVAHVLGEAASEAVPQEDADAQGELLRVLLPELVKLALPQPLGGRVALAVRHREAVPLPEREAVPLRGGVAEPLPEREGEGGGGELLTQALTMELNDALPEKDAVGVVDAEGRPLADAEVEG